MLQALTTGYSSNISSICVIYMRSHGHLSMHSYLCDKKRWNLARTHYSFLLHICVVFTMLKVTEVIGQYRLCDKKGWNTHRWQYSCCFNYCLAGGIHEVTIVIYIRRAYVSEWLFLCIDPILAGNSTFKQKVMYYFQLSFKSGI